jgi:hypothetical protein
LQPLCSGTAGKSGAGLLVAAPQCHFPREWSSCRVSPKDDHVQAVLLTASQIAFALLASTIAVKPVSLALLGPC